MDAFRIPPSLFGDSSHAARNFEIFMARKSGHTLDDIACRYDLSRERIRQICARGETMLTRAKEVRRDPWFRLSPRARNALGAHGINDLAELQRAKSEGVCFRALTNIGVRIEGDIERVLRDDAQ